MSIINYNNLYQSNSVAYIVRRLAPFNTAQ